MEEFDNSIQIKSFDEFEYTPEMDENLLKLKLFPIIIRPNLGNPEFICPKNFSIKQLQEQFKNSKERFEPPELLSFEFEGLIASSKNVTIDDIISSFDKNLYIYPLSENIENNRAIRLSKIPVVIKEIKTCIIKDISEDDYDGNPQIYLKSENVYPGREVFYKAKFIFKVPIEIFYKRIEISTEFNFNMLRKYVVCDIIYDLTDETLFSIDSADDNYIKYFIKFQDAKTPPKNIMRINYHSLVLCLSHPDEIDSLQIWQISDLHIEKSNDEMPYVIFNKIKNTKMREKDLEKASEALKRFNDYILRNYNPDEFLKSINEKIKDSNSYIYPISVDQTPYEISEFDLPYSDDDFFWQLPIEYRVQNPNNNFRLLIYQANEEFKRGNLDFIVITGDLVDFVGTREKRKQDFKDSNWKVFIDILLGKPNKTNYKGLLPPEELIVPIFTIPGNHDYRGYPYPPSFVKESIGFTTDEIKLYTFNKLHYLLALRANIKFLRGYFQFINCDLNFIKRFGKTHFIFLDTDKDSFKDIYDLIYSNPSSRGLRDSQLKWLKNYCNKNVKDDEHVIIFMHTPVFNPPKLEMLRETLEKIFPELKEEEKKTNKKLISINLLKEYSLIDKMDDPRIDPLIDLKFGTILNNWEQFLSFCLNCRDKGILKPVDLVVCGHAHKNLEFRLEPLMGRKLETIPNLEILPLKKLQIPCAVYMGNYSDEYKAEMQYFNKLFEDDRKRRLADHNLITNKNPFILLTTTIGPRSQKEYSNLQGYRKIIIKENRIEEFSVYPLLRYFIPFENYLDN